MKKLRHCLTKKELMDHMRYETRLHIIGIIPYPRRWTSRVVGGNKRSIFGHYRNIKD